MRTAMKIAMKIRPAAETIISLAMAATIALTTATATCQAENTTKPADPNTFVSKKDGFSIRFPAGWQQAEVQPPAAVLFIEPPTDESDSATENVLVLVQHKSDKAPLDTFAKGYMEGMARRAKVLRVISSERLKLGELEAQRVVVEHKAGELSLKGLVYILVSDKRGYVISCTGEASKFAKYEPIFEDICKTFQTFEPDPPKPQLFTSTEHGFSIKGPAGWNTLKGKPPFAVSFIRPQAEEFERFRERVSVTAELLPKGTGLDVLAAGVVEGLTTSTRNLKLVSSREVKLGRRAARRLVLEQSDDVPKANVICYVLISEGRGYSISLITNVADLAKYEPVFEEVCKTFETFKPDPPKPQPFVSEKDGFRITGPAGWEQTTGNKFTVVGYKQALTDPSDSTHEVIDVSVDTVQAGTDLDAFANARVKAMRERLKEFKLISSKKVELGSTSAVRVVMQDKPRSRELKSLIYIVIANGREYSIYCIAAADQYDKYEPIFEEVCKTFETFEPVKDVAKEGRNTKGELSPDKL